MSFVNDVFSVSAEVGVYSAKEEATSKLSESIFKIKAKVLEKVCNAVSFVPGIVRGRVSLGVDKLEKAAKEELEEAKGREAEERIKAKYYGKAKVAAFVVAGGVQALPVLEAVAQINPPRAHFFEKFRNIGGIGSFSLPDINFPKIRIPKEERKFNFSFLKKLKPPSLNLSLVSQGVSKASDSLLKNEDFQDALMAGAEKGIEMGVSEVVDKEVDNLIAPIQQTMNAKIDSAEAEVRSKLDCCCVRGAVGECITDIKTVALFRTRRCRASYASCVLETKSFVREKTLGAINFLTSCFITHG